MDKYLHYNLMDFVEDEGYIRYVQKRSRPGDQDWEKWIAAHPEKQNIVSEARTLIEAIAFQEEASEGSKEKVWEQIFHKTNSKATQTVSKPSILRWLAPLAAAACLGFVLYFTMGGSSSQVIETVAFGDTKSIELPDGSTVRINAGSTLSYDSESYNTARTIHLEGEAFFDVRRGVPFEVITDGGTVHVLGTSFNVYGRGNELDVDVRTGVVLVASGKSEHRLQAGEHVSLEHGKPQEVDRIWDDNRYTYKKIKLAQVLQDLERTYNIEVDAPSTYMDTLYTGSFATDDAHTALIQVLWPLNLDFTLNNNKATVTKKTD